MDPDHLRYESFENLYTNSELDWGLLCFNQAHQKQEVLKLTIDINEILTLLKNGWEKHIGRNQYILRAPEKVLCDLSEEKVNPTADPRLLLDYYSFLNNIDLWSFLAELKEENKKIKNLKVIPLKGSNSVSEIRVAGSNQLIKLIPGLAFQYFLKKVKKNNKKFVNKKLTKVNELSDLIKKFYKEIYLKYYQLGYKLPTNPDIPEMELWQKFKDEYDFFVFIPKSAIKYCMSFLEKLGDNYIKKIILWEYHTGNDVNKELILFKKNIKGKKVLLIDRSFSSYTLAHLAQKIKENGAKKVDRLAIAPKSQAAISNSEFCFFWNKLLDSTDIDLRDDWAVKLFKKVNNIP